MSNDDLPITSLTDLPDSETKEGQIADLMLDLMKAVDDLVAAGTDSEVALNALLGAYLNLSVQYGVDAQILKRALADTAGRIERIMAQIRHGRPH